MFTLTMNHFGILYDIKQTEKTQEFEKGVLFIIGILKHLLRAEKL